MGSAPVGVSYIDTDNHTHTHTLPARISWEV